MIGITKLVCGLATVADAMRLDQCEGEVSPRLLQFSSHDRPLVVWNTTNRCNLRCLHCYIQAEDHDYKNELSTKEAKALIDDLGQMQVPVLLFSGGEPILRHDLYELGDYATKKGIRAVISSNGTIITPEAADRIKRAGFRYVGISIDGTEKTHDHFRKMPGSFKKALEGVRNCLEAGVMSGVRFTVNRHNFEDLPEILDLCEREKIPRFCLYHLVYAGRGKEMVMDDITPGETRSMIRMLIEKAKDWCARGIETEMLTTDNHADGIYIKKYLDEMDPDRAKEVGTLLKMHGGCSAGTKMSNIDPFGNVHPCQFWSHLTLGNIREKRFSEIWLDPDNPVLKKLRKKAEFLKGRCGECKYADLCAGCRIRAEVVHGDKWAEDPACFLSQEEIKGEMLAD
ncbi:radical SAM protein [bacterium]|nr:radical SAM protein [bacterium]